MFPAQALCILRHRCHHGLPAPLQRAPVRCDAAKLPACPGCGVDAVSRATGRNDDPLLFVKELHRQLVGMAADNAHAVARLFSAMNSLTAFAKNQRSGVVCDDVDLFCKLHAELLRCSLATPAAMHPLSGGNDAGDRKSASGVDLLPPAI